MNTIKEVNVTIKRNKLLKYTNSLLNIYDFKDYGPNGLQIEGKEEIAKVAFAVSATADSVAQAVEWGADALMVHHGLFWRFHGPKTITGPFAKRIKPLIQNEINLIGYHLPLDANLELGNAVSIANMIGLENIKPFGDHKGSPTGVQGKFKSPIQASALQTKLESLLNHEVLLSTPDQNEKLKNMGIITGGANGDWVLARQAQLDGYLTGEMSEHDWHEAREGGVHFFAGGHHATEKFGIQKLQERIEKEFNLETIFIDSDNRA
jgi:dinuclear metal center YbgI/SA1388 family protein